MPRVDSDGGGPLQCYRCRWACNTPRCWQCGAFIPAPPPEVAILAWVKHVGYAVFSFTCLGFMFIGLTVAALLLYLLTGGWMNDVPLLRGWSQRRLERDRAERRRRQGLPV